MYAPRDQAPAASSAPGAAKTPWRVRDDGSTVFRMMPPLVGWWAWVAFAALCLGDLAVQGRDWTSLQAAVVLVAITGIMYACTLRPRVTADRDGITVHNPLRDHRVPWESVRGIFLGDSVELVCARPAPKKDKTIYSWALYTRRRSQARAQLRSRGWGSRDRQMGRSAGYGRPVGYAQASGYGRMPEQARELAAKSPAEIMAAELGRLREQARARQAGEQQAGERPVAEQAAEPPAGEHRTAAGPAVVAWAWQPLAAILIPLAGFVLVLLVR